MDEYINPDASPKPEPNYFHPAIRLMITNKRRSLSYYRSRVKDFNAKLALAPYFPTLGKFAEMGEWISIIYPTFVLPYSMALIKEFEDWATENLEANGWKRFDKYDKRINNAKDAWLDIKFHQEFQEIGAVFFEVRFSSTKEGSTCVIREIQNAIVGQDAVYEIICEEGAEEDALGLEKETNGV